MLRRLPERVAMRVRALAILKRVTRDQEKLLQKESAAVLAEVREALRDSEITLECLMAAAERLNEGKRPAKVILFPEVVHEQTG